MQSRYRLAHGGSEKLTHDQDRPWNDPGPRRGRIEEHSDKPTLKAIILDFSSVNNVDITSVQHLIDVRNQLDRYASPDKVDWHLACINNRWTKRALASAGFGFPTPVNDGNMMERWKPIFSVAELGGQDSAAAAAQYRENARRVKDVEGRKASRDTDTVGQDESASSDSNEFVQTIVDSKAYGGGVTSRVVVVHGLNRPLFHIDLTSALQSAIANVERIGEYEAKGVGTPAP